jgi:hypothetical protein
MSQTIHARLMLQALLAIAFLLPPLDAAACGLQQTTGAQTTNQSAPAPEQPSEPTGPRIPILGLPDEEAWLSNLEYYAPLPGFNRTHRDADVQALRVARAWHFRSGWEFQFDLTALRANGTRTEPPAPPQSSNAAGGGFGPLVRWNVVDTGRWRFFAEAQTDFLLTNNSFPVGGTAYNAFTRGGGGLSFRLNRSYWVEAAFHFAHISNANLALNPLWNGQGFSLGLRKSAAEEGANAQTTAEAGLPPGAEKGAWSTSFEVYAPEPGFNRTNRDIDLRVFRVNHAWVLPRGFEVSVAGMVLDAKGTQDDPGSPAQVEASNAIAIGAGPGIRWNGLRTNRVRLFAESDFNIIRANSGLPAEGGQTDFFFEGGCGAGFRVVPAYWVEAGFDWAHISNFGGVAWSGVGVRIALRRVRL